MAELEDVEGLQEKVYDLAVGGKPVELKSLLEEHPGLDVDEHENEYGWRALFWACLKGHTECARLLIDHKADVDAKSNDGSSALHGAARMGHMGCAKLLVQNRADVNCHDDDAYTPLMTSKSYLQQNITQYLLEQKADVYYRDVREESTEKKASSEL
jgi:ankyrin repeat protein